MGKISINQDALKSRREWKRHKIQDGSNVFRVLPPFGDVEVHNNYPYRKWSTVWLIDPKTQRRRPFATPMTDGEDCPVKEYNDALTKFIDGRKSSLEAKGVPEAKVKAALEGLRSVQWQTRVGHSYAYNAADKSGEVGVLELKSTAHQGMKKKMSEYIKEYGQDPTTLESDLKENAGVWFQIDKEGKGKDTTYTVNFAQIKKKNGDGEIQKFDDRTPLSDNIVQNYEEIGYDLNTVYARKSYDELKEILLFNLAVLAKETPECVIAGYDVSNIDVEAVSTDDDSGDEIETTVKPEVTKTSTRKVALNLDDGDDAVDMDTATMAQTKTKKAPNKSTQDFMKMADDILGDD